MDMPDVVRAYFDADRRSDVNALTEVFVADSVVQDEGARYEGIGAIRSWWVEAKEKYHHVAEPFQATDTGDKVAVRAKVSGEFPNSPATLNFSFTVADDKIVALEIK